MRTVTGPASVPGVSNPKPSTEEPRFGSMTSNFSDADCPSFLTLIRDFVGFAAVPPGGAGVAAGMEAGSALA